MDTNILIFFSQKADKVQTELPPNPGVPPTNQYIRSVLQYAIIKLASTGCPVQKGKIVQRMFISMNKATDT